MIYSQIRFFATTADISTLLEAFENEVTIEIKFVDGQRSYSENVPVYFQSADIPEKGVATHETAIASKTLTILPTEDRLLLDQGKERTGRVYWNVWHPNHKNGVGLIMGGHWGDDTLLPGEFTALNKTESTVGLVKSFRSALKKCKFKKVDLWWVGPEALNMLCSGKRLATHAAQSPPEFDLFLPGDLEARR